MTGRRPRSPRLNAMSCDPLELRGTVAGPPDYSIPMLNTIGWINSNDRGAWTKSHGRVRDWRYYAGVSAFGVRVPRLTRAYCLAELRFPDRRRRDPANWYPTVKAAVDGLVQVGVLADDDSGTLLGPDMRIGATHPSGCLTLHLWRLPDVSPG